MIEGIIVEASIVHGEQGYSELHLTFNDCETAIICKSVNIYRHYANDPVVDLRGFDVNGMCIFYTRINENNIKLSDSRVSRQNGIYNNTRLVGYDLVVG